MSAAEASADEKALDGTIARMVRKYCKRNGYCTPVYAVSFRAIRRRCRTALRAGASAREQS